MASNFFPRNVFITSVADLLVGLLWKWSLACDISASNVWLDLNFWSLQLIIWMFLNGSPSFQTADKIVRFTTRDDLAMSCLLYVS